MSADGAARYNRAMLPPGFRSSALRVSLVVAAAALAAGMRTAAAQPPPSVDPADLVRQGQQKDLAGQYADARKDFAKALEAADSQRAKSAALRSMAISYAFERNCKAATPYESQLYETLLAQGAFYDAGEVADELARICIDAGSLDEALKWYQVGHTAGLREPKITPARKDLWDFRWEHAQARIAARRGRKADADAHVAEAKKILDRGTNPDQAVFFPYLTGYVALYTGDYKTALADLQRANQNDPFIQCLIAQTYEKLGDKAQATTYYRKALTTSNAHNPPNAYARPLARKKVGNS